MKRITVTFALLLSASFAFATKSSINNFNVQKTVESLKLSYPSGSGTVTDACGNEYEIEWSCNYNCSGLAGTLAVIQAIQAWADDNTDCGFDSYTAD